MPIPNRNSNTSRTVIDRRAGTVSVTDPAGSTITRRSASSGSRSSTESSNARVPSSTSVIASAATIGLVVEDNRNTVCTSMSPPPGPAVPA